MSRVRKEARIIDLYENYGYTVKEICKEERVSATTVTDIIKKLKRCKEPPLISARAKAFQLFRQANSLLDVAIKLDLSHDDTMSYYLEYLKLNGSSELLALFQATEVQIEEFVPFFRSCKALNLNPDLVKEALPLIKQMPGITHKISLLTLELENKRNSITIMEQHIRKLKSEQALLESDLAEKRLKSHIIKSNIAELEQVEAAYRNSDFHRTVRKIAAEVATRILENKNIYRIEARVAISKVVRQRPELLPIISPPANFYDAQMEAKYSYLLEQSLKEGHEEFLNMIMPTLFAKLREGIDEYQRPKNIPIGVETEDIPVARE
jgi:hypothetical protein